MSGDKGGEAQGVSAACRAEVPEGAEEEDAAVDVGQLKFATLAGEEMGGPVEGPPAGSRAGHTGGSKK